MCRLLSVRPQCSIVWFVMLRVNAPSAKLAMSLVVPHASGNHALPPTSSTPPILASALQGPSNSYPLAQPVLNDAPIAPLIYAKVARKDSTPSERLVELVFLIARYVIQALPARPVALITLRVIMVNLASCIARVE